MHDLTFDTEGVEFCYNLSDWQKINLFFFMLISKLSMVTVSWACFGKWWGKCTIQWLKIYRNSEFWIWFQQLHFSKNWLQSIQTWPWPSSSTKLRCHCFMMMYSKFLYFRKYLVACKSVLCSINKQSWILTDAIFQTLTQENKPVTAKTKN